MMADSSNRIDAARLDVAAILEGLRAEVRARRIAQGQLDLSPLERDLQRSLDEIELYRVVSAHWPLTGGTLPQRAINLVNKLVRRYLRWYINPIVEQQNAYNDAVARALRLLADAYADLGEQLAEGRPRTRDQGPGTRDDGQSPGMGTGNRGLGDAGTSQAPSPKPQAPSPSGGEGARYSIHNLMSEVQSRAMSEPPARFPDLELRALEPQLRLRAQVVAHWPLTGRTLPQRAVALANKLVRRYLRWYINPIVEQQNGANAAITAALAALMRLDDERRTQVAARRARDRVTG